jgi:nucleotidyltransferase substrate binding protein (TIGR01987 family)
MATLQTSEFEKALKSLEYAYSQTLNHSKGSDEFKLARDATIQRFEFCVELSWKISAKFLGSSSTAAKPVLREMLQNKYIINIETWFQFIEARNKSSHTYDEEIAAEVYSVVALFLPEARSLLSKLVISK